MLGSIATWSDGSTAQIVTHNSEKQQQQLSQQQGQSQPNFNIL